MALSHRHIEAFRAVILTGSLTRAAEALRTSQPTISRVLQSLGTEVGFKLFQRQGRRVVPTREALVLFNEVESSYQGLQRIADAAQSIRKTGGERLRIAAVTSVCLGVLPKALAALRRSFPDVGLVVEAGRYDSILSRVSSRQCDIGLALVPDGEVEIHVEPFADVQAVCVLPSDHALAARSAVTPEDLARSTLIFVGQHVPSRRQVDDLFASSGLRCETRLEVQSGVIACAMVAEGLGIAVLDALTVAAAIDPRLTVRPLRPTVVFRYSAMMSRSDAGGRLVGALIEAIRTTVRGMAATSPFIREGLPRAPRRRKPEAMSRRSSAGVRAQKARG